MSAKKIKHEAKKLAIAIKNSCENWCDKCKKMNCGINNCNVCGTKFKLTK